MSNNKSKKSKAPNKPKQAQSEQAKKPKQPDNQEPAEQLRQAEPVGQLQQAEPEREAQSENAAQAKPEQGNAQTPARQEQPQSPSGKSAKLIRSRPGRFSKRRARVGYLFVLPWVIGFIAFVLVPLGQSFYYMWYNIRITPTGMKFNFVGTGNITQIWLEDPEFPTELLNYVWRTVAEVPIIVVFALMIALMLNQKIFARGFFRMLFFLPVIAVSGPVMNLMVSEGASSIPAMNTEAILNTLDAFLPHALAAGVTDIFSNMIMILWYSGVQILIFISALQKVDPSLYEAAKMDGASDWECFWKITLATIKPMALLCSVYTVIFLSSNEQNPLINMIKNAMFSGTKEKGYGYASAMAWMYAIVISLIVLLFFLLLGPKKDSYDKLVKKVARAEAKEMRMIKRVKRRSARNAAKRKKAQQNAAR